MVCVCVCVCVCIPVLCVTYMCLYVCIIVCRRKSISVVPPLQTTCTPFWPDYHSRVKDFRFRQVNHKETTRRDGCYDFITLEIFDRRKVMVFPLAVWIAFLNF